MLQWINDRMKVIGWIFILPLALVFAVWGVQGIVDFSTRKDRGLKVNGEDLDLEQVRQDYQQRLAQLSKTYPDAVPPELRARVQAAVVEQFVNTTLVTQQVQSQGYVVSDRDVLEAIQSYPGFQIGGKFNRDAYYSLLRARGYSPEKFEAEERLRLRGETLQGGLMVSTFTSPTELGRWVALRGETREVGYALLPLAKFQPPTPPAAAALEAYYQQHLKEFMTAETVTLNYVELKVADGAAAVAVDEASLRSYYDGVKDRYAEPEKRHAEHVLIQSGSDDAAAKKQAETVLAEALKPGTDFEALAKKYSQDAGSAPQGGDLGWAERSAFVGPFASTLFKMQAGEIKGPIKTEFGWHLIKLLAIQPGKSKSFEEVRAQLEPEYRKLEAEKRYGEQQEKIEQLAFEHSGSLEPVATALGLTQQTIQGFQRGLQGIELAANPKVIEAAFSADVLGGQNSRAIELAPGTVVVLRASDHRLPEQRSLESVRAAVDSGLRNELAAKAARAAAAEVAAALAAGTHWEAALKPHGALKAEPARYVGRTEKSVPKEILAAAFAIPAPAAGQVASGSVQLPSGEAAAWALTAVKPGAPNGDGSAERRQLAEADAVVEYAAYLAALRARADVHINPAIFE